MPHTILAPTKLRLALAALVALAWVVNPLARADSPAHSVQSGWWWAAQASPTTPVPVARGTEPGELLISRQAGAHEKAAAVRIDVAALTEPPRVMVIAMDELDSTANPLNSGDLLACPVHSGAWEPAQGGAWSARPRGGCVAPYASVGSREDSGRWTFDVTAMATAWVNGTLPNDGFELVPAQSLSAPTFEIGLNAPSPDDVYLLTGASTSARDDTRASQPPAVAPPALGGQSSEDVVPSPPLARTPAEEPVTSPVPTAPAPAPSAYAAPAAPTSPTLRMVTTLSSNQDDAPAALEIFALIACASAAIAWSRLRAAGALRP